jgi:hypothetical protein
VGFFSKEREEVKQGCWRYFIQRNNATALFPLTIIAAMCRQTINRRQPAGSGEQRAGSAAAGYTAATPRNAGVEGTG